MRRLILVIPFVLGCAGLCSVGLWQLDRAQEKRARFADYSARIAAAPLDIDALPSATGLDDQRWRRARLSGHYLDRHVVLDNRIAAGQAGYEVLTPFATPAGRVILVDRGWIPLSGSRDAVPDVFAPADTLEIDGFLGGEPVVGIQLGADSLAAELLAPGVFRVQRVDLAALAPLLAAELWSAILYLDTDAGGALRVDWPLPGDGSARHTAYAVLWFVMAAVLATIGVRNLKRARPADHV